MSGAVIPFCVPDGATILSAVALSWTMLRFGSGGLDTRMGQKDAREGGVNFFARFFSSETRWAGGWGKSVGL